MRTLHQWDVASLQGSPGLGALPSGISTGKHHVTNLFLVTIFLYTTRYTHNIRKSFKTEGTNF